MRLAFILSLLLAALVIAGCNGASSTNPGGHSAEEIARAEQQGPPPAPSQQAAAQPTAGGNYDGQQLYAQYCGSCHNGGKAGPPLVGVFQRRELPSGTPANDAMVKQTILMGRAMMPAFQNTLNQDQVNAIVQYLHTM